MTVAVETELRSRIAALESDVAFLKRQLERAEINAAIRRGRSEAAAGLTIPAREVVENLRAKLGLPKS